MDEFCWEEDSLTSPEANFADEYPKKIVKLPDQYFQSTLLKTFLDEIVSKIFIGTIGYPRLDMYWAINSIIPSFPRNMSSNIFHFRNDVANGLLALSDEQACSRKQGRPTLSLNEETRESPSTLKKRQKYTSPLSLRYDRNQYWAEHTQNKGRCKFKGCKEQTRYT